MMVLSDGARAFAGTQINDSFDSDQEMVSADWLCNVISHLRFRGSVRSGVPKTKTKTKKSVFVFVFGLRLGTA